MHDAAPPAASEPDGPEPPQAGEQAVPDRRCAHHADARATWHCEGCDAWLCEECVRIYATRDGKVASCRQCGDVCIDPAHPPLTGARAGGVESPGERRSRVRRDSIYPAVAAGATTVILAGMGLAGGGLSGLGFAIASLLAGATITLTVMLVLESGGWVDFGDTDQAHFPLKAVATVGLLLTLRAVAAATVGLTTPGGQEATTATGIVMVDGLTAAIMTWVKAIIVFIFMPLLTLWLATKTFFRLGLSDAVGAITFIYLAESATLGLLLFLFLS